MVTLDVVWFTVPAIACAVITYLAWHRGRSAVRFLKGSAGKVPPWELDHVASHACAKLRALCVGNQRTKMLAAVRDCEVLVVDGKGSRGFDPSNPLQPGLCRYHVVGQHIVIAHEGWERHLATAVAHVAKVALTGEPDAARTDRTWFNAAVSVSNPQSEAAKQMGEIQ